MTLLRLSGSVACRRCRESMAAGDPAVARVTAISDVLRWSAYHPDCLLDVDCSTLLAALSEDAPAVVDMSASFSEPWALESAAQGRAVSFDGKEELRNRALKRMSLLQRVQREAHERRVRKVVEGGSVVRRKDEIALDRKGRPRVELLWSAVGVDRMDADEVRQELLPDRTFASSLREYVLVDSGKHAPLRLPWEPLIGALFVVFSEVKLTRRAIERPLQWNAFGLPTPALWVIGPPGAARDNAEQQMRTFLDEAGFVGDEARCLVSDAISADAIAQLGAMLDDAFSIDAPPKRAVDARETLLATLESAVRDKRVATYSTALAQVTRRLRGMTPAMKARAADCAAACLTEESARKSALALLASQPHRRSVETIRAALVSLLAGGRAVTKDAQAIWDLLVEWEDDGRLSAVCDLVCAESAASKRSEQWLELLRDTSDATVGERLKTWAESLAVNDARKPVALDIAGAIARNAARSPVTKPKAAKR